MAATTPMMMTMTTLDTHEAIARWVRGEFFSVLGSCVFFIVACCSMPSTHCRRWRERRVFVYIKKVRKWNMCVEFCFILRKKSEHISLPSSSLFCLFCVFIINDKNIRIFFGMLQCVSFVALFMTLWPSLWYLSCWARALVLHSYYHPRARHVQERQNVARACWIFYSPWKPLSNRHPTIQVESEQSSLNSHHCLTLLIRKIN